MRGQKGHDVMKTGKSILRRGWSMLSSGNRRMKGMETALDMTKRRFLINWEAVVSQGLRGT